MDKGGFPKELVALKFFNDVGELRQLIQLNLF